MLLIIQCQPALRVGNGCSGGVVLKATCNSSRTTKNPRLEAKPAGFLVKDAPSKSMLRCFIPRQSFDFGPP
jgi:hypothetical protein